MIKLINLKIIVSEKSFLYFLRKNEKLSFWPILTRVAGTWTPIIITLFNIRFSVIKFFKYKLIQNRKNLMRKLQTKSVKVIFRLSQGPFRVHKSRTENGTNVQFAAKWSHYQPLLVHKIRKFDHFLSSNSGTRILPNVLVAAKIALHGPR